MCNRHKLEKPYQTVLNLWAHLSVRLETSHRLLITREMNGSILNEGSSKLGADGKTLVKD